jgi:hypothetical protein
MTVFIKKDLAILYVHVPKTGGTTITNTFRHNGFSVEMCDQSSITNGMNSFRLSSPQHYHADLLRQTLRLNRFKYIFMTVRHPLCRIKSEYLWNVRDVTASPNKWAHHILDVYHRDPYILDNHIRPQIEFQIEGADVFRSEEGFGSQWLSKVSEKVGMELRSNPHPAANVAYDFSGRTVSDVVFDPYIIEEINEFYRADFERFGYAY